MKPNKCCFKFTYVPEVVVGAGEPVVVDEARLGRHRRVEQELSVLALQELQLAAVGVQHALLELDIRVRGKNHFVCGYTCSSICLFTNYCLHTIIYLRLSSKTKAQYPTHKQQKVQGDH